MANEFQTTSPNFLMPATPASTGVPGQPGRAVVPSPGRFGANMNDMGLNQIMQILLSQGQIAPQQLNQQISQSNRAGQGVQQGIQTRAAQNNLQNSGLFEALQAATGQATAGREANLRAGFATDAANRQRQDLVNLLLPLFGIQLDDRAISEGVSQSNQNRRQQRDAADQAFIGSLFGSVLG